MRLKGRLKGTSFRALMSLRANREEARAEGRAVEKRGLGVGHLLGDRGRRRMRRGRGRLSRMGSSMPTML